MVDRPPEYKKIGRNPAVDHSNPWDDPALFAVQTNAVSRIENLKNPTLTIDDLLFLDRYGDGNKAIGLRHVSDSHQYESELAYGATSGDALALSGIGNIVMSDFDCYVQDPILRNLSKLYDRPPLLSVLVPTLDEVHVSRLLGEFKQSVFDFLDFAYSYRGLAASGITVREAIQRNSDSHYFMLVMKSGNRMGRDSQAGFSSGLGKLGKFGSSPHAPQDIKASILPDEINKELTQRFVDQLDLVLKDPEDETTIFFVNSCLEAFWAVFIRKIHEIKASEKFPTRF